MGRLHVRVQPGARRSVVVGWYGDLPKIAVAAPPVDGAANEEVRAVIAATLDVTRRSVRLVGGATARTKRFEIDGLDDDEIRRRLVAAIPPPSR